LLLTVSSGTWSEYPPAYQVSFLRDVFWAANNYHARTGAEKAAKGTLAEEQLLNETADVRIIGVTLETRPDSITGVEVCKTIVFSILIV
jgi:histone acetyltransferase (RNA polymerase elongator complex component)